MIEGKLTLGEFLFDVVSPRQKNQRKLTLHALTKMSSGI